MSIHNLIHKKVTVRWGSRVIIISEQVSFLEVHEAIKSAFFYRSKFLVPMLNHSSNIKEIGRGAPELKRLILEEGWRVIGEGNITNAVTFTNTFTSEDGESVTHLVIEPQKSIRDLIA